MAIDIKIIYDSLKNFKDADIEAYIELLDTCIMREFETRIAKLTSPRDLSILLGYAVSLMKDEYRLERLRGRYARATQRAEKEAVANRKWYENEDRFDGVFRKFV